MTAIERIRDFLDNTNDISLGYNELIFFNSKDLEKEQVGYSLDENGSSLSTGQFGDWQKAWIAIGNDSLGDPIFIDNSQDKLPVFTAQHGEGLWEPRRIASDLDNFKAILKDLRELSINRQTPVELEDNPLDQNEVEQLLRNIGIKNDVDLEYWEEFLESDD